jgi:hypothetical protein
MTEYIWIICASIWLFKKEKLNRYYGRYDFFYLSWYVDLLPVPFILFWNVQESWLSAENDCKCSLPHFSCALWLALSRSQGAPDAVSQTDWEANTTYLLRSNQTLIASAYRHYCDPGNNTDLVRIILMKTDVDRTGSVFFTIFLLRLFVLKISLRPNYRVLSGW